MEQLKTTMEQMVLNLEPVMPELPEQRLGNDFIKALQSESLQAASNEQISQVLRFAMVMIGLRAQNWPNDEEKIILLSFIRANYYQHKIAELRLAFEMAVAGKLELGESGATCYENFSCEYVGRIMRAYRKWASQEHESLPTDPPAGLLDYRMPRIDWAEEWEQLKEYAKSGNLEKCIIVTPLYDWLVENGIMNLTGSQKKEFYIAARTALITDLKNSQSSGMLSYDQKHELDHLQNEGWANNPAIKVKLQNKAKILAVKWLAG